MKYGCYDGHIALAMCPLRLNRIFKAMVDKRFCIVYNMFNRTAGR